MRNYIPFIIYDAYINIYFKHIYYIKYILEIIKHVYHTYILYTLTKSSDSDCITQNFIILPTKMTPSSSFIISSTL